MDDKQIYRILRIDEEMGQSLFSSFLAKDGTPLACLNKRIFDREKYQAVLFRERCFVWNRDTRKKETKFSQYALIKTDENVMNRLSEIADFKGWSFSYEPQNPF